MYCPKCATPNIDPAKFCRVCGTNLEAVGLALSDNNVLPIKSAATGEAVRNADWLAKKGADTRQVVQGSVLLAVSSLIAMVAFLVTRGSFAWFPIWAIIFGWMTCWGAFSLALGLGGLIEARAMQRGLDSKPDTTSLLDAASAVRTPTRASVTEHTTRQLEQKNP